MVHLLELIQISNDQLTGVAKFNYLKSLQHMKLSHSLSIVCHNTR